MKLIELEEALHKLGVQIAEIEETNELLFNQEKFNSQRFENLSERITKMINECQIKYQKQIQQMEILQKGITKI